MTTTASRLHFLAYAPRSGSTLFASEMAKSVPALLVVPEFRTAEYLLSRSEREVRSLSACQLVRVLEADRQLGPSLGLTAPDIDEIASELAGHGTTEILVELVSRYAGRKLDGQDILLKLSSGAELVRRALEISDDGRVIHVYRDGRAVVNSLLRTPKAYFSNETMGRGDVIYCTGLWLKQQQLMHSVRRIMPNVIEVRYEEFLKSPTACCLETAASMGVVHAGSLVGAHGHFDVAETEALLHPLMHGPAVPERVDAWRTELSVRAGVFAEWRMRRQLETLGYSRWFLQDTAARRKLPSAWAQAHLRHLFVVVKHYAKRSAQFAARPLVAREHLRARRRMWLQRRQGLS